MRFGVLRETLAGERRVPVTPEGVRVLSGLDHSVVVESNVGIGSGFSDTEYLAAGAEIAYTAREVAAEAEVVLRVHPPSVAEVDMLRPRTLLAAFLHLAGQPAALHTALAAARVSTLSLELVREGVDEYPILEPLSAIGGRVAVTLRSEVAWAASSVAPAGNPDFFSRNARMSAFCCVLRPPGLLRGIATRM